MIHIYQKHFVSVANRTAITQEGWDEARLVIAISVLHKM